MNSDIPNFSPYKSSTICASSYGFNYGTTYKSRIRHHSHHCRSWMLARSDIPSLPYDDNGSPNCSKIFAASLSLVWTTRQDDFGPRSLIHITFWQSINTGAWYSTKYIHSIPSSNRRPHGMYQPMDRTISTPHSDKSKGLEHMVTCGNGYTQ